MTDEMRTDVASYELVMKQLGVSAQEDKNPGNNANTNSDLVENFKILQMIFILGALNNDI
jgi:hypothetical protein